MQVAPRNFELMEGLMPKARAMPSLAVGSSLHIVDLSPDAISDEIELRLLRLLHDCIVTTARAHIIRA